MNNPFSASARKRSDPRSLIRPHTLTAVRRKGWKKVVCEHKKTGKVDGMIFFKRPHEVRKITNKRQKYLVPFSLHFFFFPTLYTTLCRHVYLSVTIHVETDNSITSKKNLLLNKMVLPFKRHDSLYSKSFMRRNDFRVKVALHFECILSYIPHARESFFFS